MDVHNHFQLQSHLDSTEACCFPFLNTFWPHTSRALAMHFQMDLIMQEAKNRMVSKLHDILRPFLLRRVKSDVETSLPPKREIVLYAPLTAKQLEIEKKLVNKTLISEVQAQLASKSGRSTLPSTAFSRSRKGCCTVVVCTCSCYLSGLQQTSTPFIR